MKHIILLAAITLTQGIANADDPPPTDKFRIDISGKNQLSIHGVDKSRRIRLLHEIYGYEVNCTKTRILAWGKPKILNKDNPQDSILTIVNLERRTKPFAIEFNKNIFNAIFLVNDNNAIIESDVDILVNLKQGILLNLNGSTSLNFNMDPEDCITFPYKSYRKYKTE